MTVAEFCRLVEMPEPEGPIADYIIFINGQPSFEDGLVDTKAKIVYLEG